MFVSTRRFETHMEYIKSQHAYLQERYWKLARAHYLLLSHLGLNEVEVPQAVKLVKKGGPEPSET